MLGGLQRSLDLSARKLFTLPLSFVELFENFLAAFTIVIALSFGDGVLTADGFVGRSVRIASAELGAGLGCAALAFPKPAAASASTTA